MYEVAQPNPELHSSGWIQTKVTKAEGTELNLKPESLAQVSGLIPEKNMCGENPNHK